MWGYLLIRKWLKKKLMFILSFRFLIFRLLYYFFRIIRLVNLLCKFFGILFVWLFLDMLLIMEFISSCIFWVWSSIDSWFWFCVVLVVWSKRGNIELCDVLFILIKVIKLLLLFLESFWLWEVNFEDIREYLKIF